MIIISRNKDFSFLYVSFGLMLALYYNTFEEEYVLKIVLSKSGPKRVSLLIKDPDVTYSTVYLGLDTTPTYSTS